MKGIWLGVELKISKKTIMIFLFIVWHLEPAYLAEFPMIDTIYSIGRVVSSFLFFLYILLRSELYIPSPVAIGALFIEIITLIVTMVYQYDVRGQINTVLSFMIVIMLDFFFKMYYKNLVDALLFIFEVLIYTNFLLIILFPEGIYNVGYNREYWLFGHVNNTIVYILPAIIIATLHLNRDKKNVICRENVRYLLLIAISVITIFIIWSVASIIGLLIMAIVYYINKNKIHLTATYAVITGLIVFYLINIVQLKWDIFGTILGFLGRDITFSARTAIWERTLKLIIQRPFWGWGKELEAIVKARLHFGQAHCRYLNIMYRGGIVCFVIQVITFFMAARCIDKHTKGEKALQLGKVITASFWLWMIQMCLETNTAPLFYFVFIIAANMENVVKQTENDRGVFLSIGR